MKLLQIVEKDRLDISLDRKEVQLIAGSMMKDAQFIMYANDHPLVQLARNFYGLLNVMDDSYTD